MQFPWETRHPKRWCLFAIMALSNFLRYYTKMKVDIFFCAHVNLKLLFLGLCQYGSRVWKILPTSRHTVSLIAHIFFCFSFYPSIRKISATKRRRKEKHSDKGKITDKSETREHQDIMITALCLFLAKNSHLRRIISLPPYRISKLCNPSTYLVPR